MRLINNTIRWARKVNTTSATYHMVADQTNTGRGYRAACNRSYLVDMDSIVTADQVDRSTYGVFCDRCQTRAEAQTAGDQMARDRDHAEAIEMDAAMATPAAWSFARGTGPLADGYAAQVAPATPDQTLYAWLDEMAPETDAEEALAEAIMNQPEDDEQVTVQVQHIEV